MRPFLFVVVKCGRFYANGLLGWVRTQRRAFKFTDAMSGPNRNAIAWAEGHADYLRLHNIFPKPARKIRIVRVVERARRAA